MASYESLSDEELAMQIAYLESLRSKSTGGSNASWRIGEELSNAKWEQSQRATQDPVYDPATDPNLDPNIEGGDGKILGENNDIGGQGPDEPTGTQITPVVPVPAAKPSVIKQKTVRKTGGTVQTVNVMSDGTEVVVDEYKDYSARDAVMAMFENTGLGDTFLNSLLASIDQVYADNIAPTDAQILNSIYNSDAYKTRFAANETIRKRIADGQGRPGDRLLKPAEYIETENTFREYMASAGLPAGFYDSPDDFSNFIANGVSPDEVKARVTLAKTALNNADQNIVKALKDYYGLTTGELTAYLLDKEKAFNAIGDKFTYTTNELEKQYAAAEVGGVALRAGVDATKAFSEEIVTAQKQGQAEAAFQTAARNQADYKRLMGLAGQTGTAEDLVREGLGLAGGTDVSLKTKKLASRERARFSQQSALDRTSLGKRNKSADV